MKGNNDVQRKLRLETAHDRHQGVLAHTNAQPAVRSSVSLGQVRGLRSARVLGLSRRTLVAAIPSAGLALDQAPVRVGVQRLSALRPVAVLDTTVFARTVFRTRENNVRLRARYDLATTDHQLREAKRLRFFVPSFVEVIPVVVDRQHRSQIATRGERGLSRADVALGQLVDALRAGGRDVVLVSDDDLLRARVPGSVDGTRFLDSVLACVPPPLKSPLERCEA